MTLDLDELERLEKAATPGPWVHHGHHATGKLWLYGTTPDGVNQPRIALIEEGLAYGQDIQAAERANANLIAAMRNALPELIAAAREAEKLREALVGLDKAARKVSHLGAQPGPQWVDLIVALGNAGAALSTTQAKSSDGTGREDAHHD